MNRMSGQIGRVMGPRPRPRHGGCDTAPTGDLWAILLGRGQRLPRHGGGCDLNTTSCDGASLLDLLRLADARPKGRR